MKQLLLAIAVAYVSIACGREEASMPNRNAPSQTNSTNRDIDTRAQAAVNLYEKTTRVSTQGLRELYFLPAVGMRGHSGWCSAYWEADKLVLRVVLSEETLGWSTLRFNLLVAHELEHCMRGVSHPDDEETPHLMRRWMLSEEEATAKTYEEWVEESLDTRPAGKPEDL